MVVTEESVPGQGSLDIREEEVENLRRDLQEKGDSTRDRSNRF